MQIASPADPFELFLKEEYHYTHLSCIGDDVTFMTSLNQLYTAETENGDRVFVKRCRDTQICENEYKHALLLYNMDNLHFIKPLAVHTQAPYSFVCFEYCPGPTLGKILETEQIQPEKIRSYVEDLYAIFKCLRASDVMHRDIHRYNFIIWKDKLRLIDFQISVSKRHYEEISLFRNPLSVLRLGNVNYKRFAWDDAFRFMDVLNRFIAPPLGIPETYQERFRFIKEEIQAHIGKDTIRYKTPGRFKILFMAMTNCLSACVSTRRERRQLYMERTKIYWQLFRGEDLGQQNGTSFHPESSHAHSQPDNLMKTGD